MAENPKTEPVAVYCLYPRERAIKGRWYHTLTCKGCAQLIYPVADPSQGANPGKLVGEAKVRVPCPKCLCDEQYPLSDLKVLQCVETSEGFRPERVPTSKSSRIPLLPQFGSAQPIMGIGLIEDRPQAAAIVGRIITAWADIEVQCARLLAKLMGTNVAPAAAVFSALRSSRTQADAMDAAASVVLSATDHLLFSAHMVRKGSLEKERNDLAHGCFGIEVSLPDSVIWISQPDYINFTTKDHKVADPVALKAYHKKMFVYRIGTLERISQEIEEFHAQLGSLVGYIGSTNAQFRSARYAQLCDQPHIREAVAHLQTVKK